MNFLITGGTGFLGSRLVKKLLEDPDNQIWITTRARENRVAERIHYLAWNGKEIPALDAAIDVVINLAGKSIADESWNSTVKKEILDSRVNAARACVEFIRNATVKPAVFIAGSAVGYYGGDRRGNTVDEQSTPGDDFMATVCKAWEAASTGSGIRTVYLRTSVILDRFEGPFPQILKPYLWYVGGPLGSGKQGFPWMHIDDWIQCVLFCIQNNQISGPVITTTPELISQNRLSNAISIAFERLNLFRVPVWALKLLLGERSIIVWGGLYARPDVLIEQGFKWKHGTIDSAMKALKSQPMSRN